MIQPEEIEDVDVFLSLSYLLEVESAERYEELADNMQIHHLDELEELFRQMAHYGEQHAQEVLEIPDGEVIPTFGTIDFQWKDPEGPETTGLDLVHYEMSIAQALDIALHNEIRGQDFYTNIALKSPNARIRELAASFADEENEHVLLLQQRIEKLTDADKIGRDDLDPPHMPE